ncbi:MAG: type I DNA topoisomerase [Candidatus Aminicenantes bacterium]|nr:type I DNA topoisomerase [Candidatus Aminicenantes bacterium]
MEKSLVIVESPAKAKTINKYLGSDYVVKASMGHIRDLPKSKLGVDVENNFAPLYEVIPERKKIVDELKKAAAEASAIILAADPDREGEAICWHLKALLGDDTKPLHRLKLHEITQPAVEEAIRHMTVLDADMFDAQQARRVLDRLVGYLISPLLWKKVARGLSAGRVQSIALRLVYERELEIRAFVPEEYWTIYAHLAAANPPPFRAALAKIDGKKAKVGDGAAAEAILTDLKDTPFTLAKINVKEKKRNPSPPYITSTLQQDAYQRLHYPVKRTMSIAQKLYEGMAIGERGPVGLITYMRTDSVRISAESLAWARAYIEKTYSARHLPSKPNVYKNKSAAQDAHEAIRPTSPDLSPEVVKPYLKKEELSLYTMIWNRFLASQMSPALIEETEFEVTAKKYLFSAKGEVLKFAGHLALTPKGENGEKETLPAATAGETLALQSLEPKQSFTQPPARYTEGTLVKELEAKGIGRPSTYAPIISTLQNRTYVVKMEGKFVPSELGMFVTEFLIKNFPDIMEIQFTAGMEEELDKIEEGKLEWTGSLKGFYARLEKDLKAAAKVESVKASGIPLNEICPKCGKPVVLKSGRFGSFKSCSGYPDCDFKEAMVKKEIVTLDELCPDCGSNLVQRKGRFGLFIACSDYPTCKYIKKKKSEDTGLACPTDCGGTILKRETKRGRFFYGCSRFPKCRYATWDEPLKQPCPKCGKPFVLRHSTKKDGTYIHCQDEVCGWREEAEGATIAPKAKEPAVKDAQGD